MVPKPKLVLYTFWFIAALSIFVLNCFGAFYITFINDTILLVEVGIF
ncbi:hypothetical protein PBI_SCTP2_314 [Salicola phage SCTP-2]|nr:hypothetical protein PBI_SCTP2_314 [Salicola phage SCTP-2]